MNKQQLAAKIWEAANRMRSKIEANEYKDYILGFIFYKYLSEKEEIWYHERGYDGESIKQYVNEETREDYSGKNMAQQSLGYFIAYKDFFSTWINMGSDFSIDYVRTALSSFNRLISPSHKKVFEGIFTTLETGLSKLGTNTKEQTKAASDLIHLIDEIPMNGKQDYDVLGFIYEYLISNFAANAGKKAGEFYTPHEVSLLMSEIVAEHLKGRQEIKIYDPTSGSGSLLINIGKTTSKYMGDKDGIRYYAQELKQNTYNLTRMNLIMRGILPDNIVTRNGDTLEEDWPYFDETDPQGTYDPLFVDAVVSNPPYSQSWNPAGKDTDPRFAPYGLAPKSKADYAFLLHDLYHLKPDGIMTIVLPHGVLFRGGEEGTIRKNLIEQNNIDTIIGLPANIFFGTGIPTIIMVLKKNRPSTDVLIIDASKGFEKEGKSNKLRASDIKRIVDTFVDRRTTLKYSRLVTREEIRANDYNLNIPRYVDSSEKPESYDLYASMYGGIPESEVDDFNSYWKVFPSLKNELFIGNGGYLKLNTEDVKKTIEENVDVNRFREEYKKFFDGFGGYLDNTLVENASSLSIPKTEESISQEIFNRFKEVPLLDPYQAFEIFENQYNSTISGDLELIQAEGIKAIKQVDPLMITKGKKGEEKEVQDGWKGHILPFDLVEKTCLADKLQEIETKKENLDEVSSSYEEILDSMSEDDKELASEGLTDENDGFVFANLKKVIKTLKADKQNNAELIKSLEKVETLNANEKKWKSELKKEEADLVISAKEKIESLTDEEVKKLLHEKWIAPIDSGILHLADTMLNDFTKKIQTLSEKYSVTMDDLEKEIQDTESSLSDMLGDLTGPESDMKAIKELQKLLGGEKDE